MQLRRKPSGVWVVDYLDDKGRRRRVSTGCKDKREAQKRAREIVNGIDVPPAPNEQPPRPGSAEAKGTTMAQLFDLCCKGQGPWSPRRAKSQRTIASNIKILSGLIGSMPITEVTYQHLRQLQRDLFARGYAPATVKRKMDAVGRALTFAEEEGLIPVRPKMPQTEVDNIQERILDEAEEVAVFAAIEKRVKAEPSRQWLRFKHLIRFLLDTGCRLSEPLQATTGWITTHQGEPVIEIPGWATKTGKGRTVPLTAAIVESLPYLRITAVNDRLFDMKPANVWYMWNTIREDVKAQNPKLNIDDVKLHTLRHTCLTRLLRGGFPLHKVSIWAGHADVKITMDRYTKVNSGELLEGAGILNRASAGSHLKVVSA